MLSTSQIFQVLQLSHNLFWKFFFRLQATTGDLGGRASCTQYTDEIIRHIESSWLPWIFTLLFLVLFV